MQVTLSADRTSTLRRAKLQRSRDGQLLGAAVFLDPATVEPYIYDNTETLVFSIEQHSDGIFLKIEGDEI